MKRFLKLFFWLCVGAAIIYGIYFAYTRWWKSEADIIGKVEGLSVQALESRSSELVGKANTASQGASHYVKDAAAGILSSLGKKLNSFAVSIVGEDGSENAGEENAFSTSTAVVNNGGGNSGASVSVPAPLTGPVLLKETQGQEFLVPPPFATIVARVNIPFSFSVNRAGVSYDINWGDGTTSSGTVPKENSFIISHEWKKQGDYTVKMDIRDGGIQKYFYSFPVRIYE